MNDDGLNPQRSNDDDGLFPLQRLDAYKLARELARLTYAAKIRDGELRDQAQRAACSVFLQLSEGLPCDKPAMRASYLGRALLRVRR